MYKPSTVRCVDQKTLRVHAYTTLRDLEIPTGIGVFKCYADIHVNAYILGSGPSTLTALVVTAHYWDRAATAQQINNLRADAERVLLQGGYHQYIRGVPNGGITGVESVIFLGPELDASVEGWQAFRTWDLERRDDDTVIVVHPQRDYWIWKDATTYRSQVEWTVPAFTTAVQAAHQARLTEYGGRIDAEVGTPKLVSDANNLHAFHVETGNTAHADGPPQTSLPPPCGKAVPNQASNPDLMLDCFALLAAKDELRGTGTLNWSVDTAIGSWDGVTTGGATSGGARGTADSTTGSHVTKVELANKGLTGSIPEELEELDLDVLKLSGNSLTGCIPVDLKDVPTNDLDDLNLLYCKPPPPAPTGWAVSETTFQLTWPAIANAGTYRLEYRLATADAWTTASDAITATEYSLDGLPCGTAHEFRLSALGSGTVYAAAWSDPWEVAETTAPCVTPVFDETSYAFTVSEDAAVGAGIGVVSATDPNGDAVSYSITSGNEDGTFVVSGVTSERSENTLILAKSLDFDTTPSYTLTVEARDRYGNASSVTVTVTEVNNAPVFGQSSYAFSVAENARQYSVVGTVAATDADGDSPTYHITAGNGGGEVQHRR